MTNLKGKPFALVGVHVGGSNAKQLRGVMAKEKITWRSFVDGGNAGAGPIATKWNLSSTPTFYLLDHKGVIREKGKVVKDLEKRVEELVREAEAAAK